MDPIAAQTAASSQEVPAGPPVLFRLAGVSLRLHGDDPAFAAEFASVFGGRAADEVSGEPTLHASLGPSTVPGFRRLRVWGDELNDPASFLLAFQSPEIPIVLAPESHADSRWKLLRLGTVEEPVLALHDGVCLVREVARWRRMLSHFLFLRLLRLRSDALYFHAASLGVAGRGCLFVGPKGTGKSTLALALAVRGHAFLGDETACYVPSTRQLLPMRRPVGIKPGPQAAHVASALSRLRPAPDPEGMMRVPIEELLPGTTAPEPIALSTVFFLGGFAAQPLVESATTGREELAQMQPMASSLVNAPATRRVFEMVRLLSVVRCYRLRPGDPDATASLIEEVCAQP